MNTLNAEPSREHMAQIGMDSLAAILAASRGDHRAVAWLVSSLEPHELVQFIAATVGHAGCILRIASQITGIDPDKIAGTCYANMQAERET